MSTVPRSFLRAVINIKMRGVISLVIAASAALASAQEYGYNNDSAAPFTIDDLRAEISIESLLEEAQTLEDFAYTTAERNRVFGSPGHNATVNYLFDELSSLDDYFTVSLQPFEALFSAGNETFTVNGVDQNATLFTYTPSGLLVDTPIVAVSNLGCNSTDYPAEVSGNIALISRGSCTFGLKSALAGAAGAAGAVVYNNVPGNLAGTLGAASQPQGPYPPTVGIPLENGQALLALLSPNSTSNSSGPVTGNLEVNSILENRTTYNVIAQSNSGNQDSVLSLGAHTDSVNQGPGINDNGSGTLGLLAVARALAQFSPLPQSYNSIRFAFWSAEEFGLLGSEYYVATLPAPELAKIKAYLNFDMIASPNFVYAIYDGDGSSFNLTGPPGSDTIERVFESYYESEGLEYTATAFDGRSDYLAFIENGIAAGGLFTGAEAIKTEAEAAIFGGVAGVAYDENYHEAGDNFTNLNAEAFRVNTEAIAYSVGTFVASFEGIPERNASTNGTVGMGKRAAAKKGAKLGGRAELGRVEHNHKKGGCAKSRVEI
jgi:carboxypeptidase Q